MLGSALSALFCFALSGCRAPNEESNQDDAAWFRHEYDSIHMAVPWHLVLWLHADDADASERAGREHAEAAFREVSRLEHVASDWDDDSELARLSRATSAAPGRLRVSRDLTALLAISIELAAASEGAFDPTIGPVTRLWRRARFEKRLPSDAEIAAARARVDWRAVHVDTTTATVSWTSSRLEFDLGGIAKGFALDAAVATLERRGVVRCLVEAGGDIACGAPPPGRHGWMIGLDNGPVRTITVPRGGIATSGARYQYVEIGDDRYSHIIDPRTGIGLRSTKQRAAPSITIVAPSATLADGLATACSILESGASARESGAVARLLERYGARRMP